MKRISIVLGALLVLFVTPCFAQECGSTFGYTLTTCENGQGCNMQYVLAPQSGDSVIWEHYTFGCCGHNVTGWVDTGASCLDASLSAKQKSNMILLLGEGIRIMTKDCVGRPVVLTSLAGVMAHNSPPIDLANHDKIYLRDLLREQKQ